MNWVGGSRRRFMKNSDTQKQKEFFERGRMRKKIHNNVGTPISPKEGNTGNMDLLSMFIVNQIAMKKEHTGKPKVANLSDSKRSHKPMCDEPIELPMSPCSPSRLSLEQSQPQYSVHTLGLKRRKHSLFGEFKAICPKLSPVLESNLSDNSASDYQHHFQDSHSSYSSSSPSSSETLTLQSRPTAHISPAPPWKLPCTKTPQLTGYAHENPMTKIQFPNILYSTVATNTADYQLNPSDRNDQQEKQLFLGFRSVDRGDHVFNGGIEIPLQKNMLFSAEAHDCSRDHKAAFIPKQVYRYPDVRSCTDSISGLENTYGSSRNACSSSDNLSQEENRQHIQTDAPHKEKCHSEDTFVTCQYCPAETSVRTRDQQALSFGQKMTCRQGVGEKQGKAPGASKMLAGICGGQDCEQDQFVLSHLQSVGKCEKAFPRPRDATTQTAEVSSSTCHEVSVQCCLLKADKLSICKEALVHISSLRKKKQGSSTRGQGRYRHEDLQTDTEFAPSQINKLKWNTPWKMSTTREATQDASEAITGHKSTHKTKSQACMKNLPLPTLPCSHTNAPDLNEHPSENVVVKGERCEGHKEECVNQNIAGNAGSIEDRGFGFVAERDVNWVSEESESLLEIADILLMLNQKSKHL